MKLLQTTVARIGTQGHHLQLLRHLYPDVLCRPRSGAHPCGVPTALIAITDGALVEGDLPRRALGLVRQWCLDHRVELERNWARAQALQPLSRISDGTAGVYDFATFVEAGTEMTAPLSDPALFAQYFVELGALTWPDGFDLSAESLRRRLEDVGGLRRDTEAA